MAAMASAAIARAAAVGPTVAAPQAHANSSLLSAKALALVTKRVLAHIPCVLLLESLYV